MIELTPEGFALATDPTFPHVTQRSALEGNKAHVTCTCGRLDVTVPMTDVSNTVNTHLNVEAAKR